MARLAAAAGRQNPAPAGGHRLDRSHFPEPSFANLVSGRVLPRGHNNWDWKMRLDAVYLVAPVPKPPSVPTRRAFLVAGATFCAGLGLGGACGYAVGVGRGAGPDEESAAPASSGDAILDELRRLATTAPIEELIEKRFDFCDLLVNSYPKDEISWRGVSRLADEAMSKTAFPDRRLFARWLAQMIEASDPAIRPTYLPLVTDLRRVK